MSNFFPGTQNRRIKTRLSAGETLGVAWLSLGHAAIAEIAAGSGADAVVFDLQHGLWERRELEAAIGLAATCVPVAVRVAENSALSIGSALDAGADCVLVPMIETAEETARAVSAARFPPHGGRSGGGVRPLVMGFGDYLKHAEGVAVGVMIETVAGVAAADAVAATPGLDFILIGTGDLSVSFSGAGRAGEVDEACMQVKAACRRAGIACGIFTPNAEKARQRRGEGFQMVVVANDIDIVKSGFATAAESFAVKS